VVLEVLKVPAREDQVHQAERTAPDSAALVGVEAVPADSPEAGVALVAVALGAAVSGDVDRAAVATGLVVAIARIAGARLEISPRSVTASIAAADSGGAC
jgi:hypothetical protein